MKKRITVGDIAEMLQRSDGGEISVKELSYQRGIEAHDRTLNLAYLLREPAVMVNQYGEMINPFRGYQLPQVTKNMGLRLNENARVTFVNFSRAVTGNQEAIVELSSPDCAKHLLITTQYYQDFIPDDAYVLHLIETGVRFYSRNGYEAGPFDYQDAQVGKLSLRNCPSEYEADRPDAVEDMFIVPIGYKMLESDEKMTPEFFAENADNKFRIDCANEIYVQEKRMHEEYQRQEALARSRKNRDRYASDFESFRDRIEKGLNGYLDCGLDRVIIKIPHPNDAEFGWEHLYSASAVVECDLALRREERLAAEMHINLRRIVCDNIMVGKNKIAMRFYIADYNSNIGRLTQTYVISASGSNRKSDVVQEGKEMWYYIFPSDLVLSHKVDGLTGRHRCDIVKMPLDDKLTPEQIKTVKKLEHKLDETVRIRATKAGIPTSKIGQGWGLYAPPKMTVSLNDTNSNDASEKLSDPKATKSVAEDIRNIAKMERKIATA